MSNDPAWNDECHVLKKKISFNKDTPNMRIKFTAENSPSIKALVRLSAEHVGTLQKQKGCPTVCCGGEWGQIRIHMHSDVIYTVLNELVTYREGPLQK